jgi:hypothetical protein
MFETNVFESVIKNNFISSRFFALLIINVKILSNLKKERCTFGKKKECLKKLKIVHFRGLSALNMQKYFLFVSSIEHINFVINGKYFQKK